MSWCLVSLLGHQIPWGLILIGQGRPVWPPSFARASLSSFPWSPLCPFIRLKWVVAELCIFNADPSDILPGEEGADDYVKGVCSYFHWDEVGSCLYCISMGRTRTHMESMNHILTECTALSGKYGTLPQGHGHMHLNSGQTLTSVRYSEQALYHSQEDTSPERMTDRCERIKQGPRPAGNKQKMVNGRLTSYNQ